jgi:hypothetical protein
MSVIADRQNTAEVLSLIRAMSAAHARVQRLEAGRLLVSTLVALTSVVGAVVPSAASTVAAVGAGWALLHGLGVSVWIQQGVLRAATMQELFDVTLFRMEWNTVIAGDPPSAAEVSGFARRYHGPEDMVTDYYEIADYRDLPSPFDVLACQMQNLNWGVRIRRRYTSGLLAVVAGWSLAGIVVGVLLELSLGRLLLIWYLPALGALLMASDIYRRQRDTAATRSRVLSLVRGRVRDSLRRPGPRDDLVVMARQVQDVIFVTRRTQARVPAWFFQRFRRQDRVDFQREVGELAHSIEQEGPGSSPSPSP